MVAISKRESGWNPNAHALDADDDSYGLWQINMKAWDAASFGISNNAQLFQPETNAHAMKVVFDAQNFRAWATDNDVTSPDLIEARQAMQLAGVGDVESSGYRTHLGRSGGGGNVVFNNTFVINGGGQGGGIDARRTATVLADHLEDEMKKRMARRN
jgi:Lysozyme like domain